MTARQSEQFRALLDEPGGMVLLTGPTGAGKTVSLYASLEHLRARGNVKIHTIEDPIEYAVDGLRQSEVNPAIELGTDELLRGVLRQSPDVVMIGEIRDEPTAHTAVWAANSGVTMLSTIHAGSAAGSVQSLRGFGVSAPFVAATLRGAVTQRLVRTLCPNCQDIDETDNDGRRAALLEEVTPMLAGNHRPDVLHVARGCEQCHGTGYAGRTGVFEILAVNDAIRDMILHGHSPQQIRAHAVEDGMLTLRQAALLKVAQGRTTLEEVRRCVPDIPLARDIAPTAPPPKVSVTLHNIAAQPTTTSAPMH
jgi:type II secretory ATPase GspE/PulE/Tfp pilus assembly ATPase PilB-like protein